MAYQNNFCRLSHSNVSIALEPAQKKYSGTNVLQGFSHKLHNNSSFDELIDLHFDTQKKSSPKFFISFEFYLKCPEISTELLIRLS